MESFLRADIFFVVTTIVVILVGAAMMAAFYYIIKILRDVKHISREVSDETDEIIKGVKKFRKGTRRGGGAIMVALSRFILGAFKKKTKK